jgi:multidrug efflux pump subunit AcrA (membrane-fusion protein)
VKTRPRPRRPRRLPLPRRPLEWGLAIVAALLIAIGVTSLGSASASSSTATKRTATVGKGVVQSTVSGNGTLEPRQKVELSFGAAGEITAIDVKAGEKVKKGQVLAEVDSSSARASLASAEAQLIEAEETVETAAEAEDEESEEVAYEGGATTEFVGLMSEDGTAAASKEDEPEAAGEERKAPEEAKEPVEKKETANGAKGTEEGTQEPEAATEAATTSQGAAPTHSAESITPTITPSESTPSSGGATVSLPTAEANLREAELAVKSARQVLRETTLRAPISGTIASVSGSVGQTSTGGIVIAQLQRLKMEVSFSEADIGKVRKGQTATVAIDSLEGTELAGRVTKVSVLPDEGSTGVVEYPATILVTQSAKGLRAGMSASAEVVVEQVRNAVTVPSEAISSAGGKTVTVEEDGEEVTKSVTTGLEGDETTEVVSGLKAGETIVLPEVTVAAASGGGETGGAVREGFGGFGAAAAAGGGFPTGGPPGGFGGAR